MSTGASHAVHTAQLRKVMKDLGRRRRVSWPQEVEEEYAEACGDEQLAASVDTARQRLLAYLQDDDSLATP